MLAALRIAARREGDEQDIFNTGSRRASFFMPILHGRVQYMKKVMLVCIIALAAAFSVTGCSSAGAANDCCQADSGDKPSCCQSQQEDDSNIEENTFSSVPDCCAGE